MPIKITVRPLRALADQRTEFLLRINPDTKQAECYPPPPEGQCAHEQVIDNAQAPLCRKIGKEGQPSPPLYACAECGMRRK